MMRFIHLIFIVSFFSIGAFAQTNENNVCEGALPFCTGTNYSFPGGVNAGNGQPGPSYDCLFTTPNPAWYYMRIANPGSITIKMYSSPSYDIDFCCWGPFDSQQVCNQLTFDKVVDCSYSTASTEYCNITGAVTGKYYILIITNFDNDPCNINFSQTSGTGTTDCTILPPPCGNNGPLCVGATLRLGAQAVNGATYHWTGPDGWTANVQNPTRPNVQMNMGGQYALVITVNGSVSDPTYTEVVVSEPPSATLSDNSTICSGDSANLTITCQNGGPWTIHYSLNGGSPLPLLVTASPFILPVSPAVTTVYTLTGVSNEICDGQASGSAEITVNPTPVADFAHSNHCQGTGTQFNDNTTPGGIVTSWYWDFDDGGANSNIQNPNYTFSHAGLFNVALQVTSDEGCEDSKTMEVEILPTPLPNAGNDLSIPYGTNTNLTGSSSGGTGNFSYHWEPALLLMNADIASPVTVPLTQTTDFTLTVTDNGNNCQKSDVMTVTITGGPVGVQIIATPNAVCPGASVNLNAQASGGSGSYSFSWISEPAGFTSSLEDVTVDPMVTTTYKVTVFDGFNSNTYSTIITVYDLPVTDAGSDQTIPNGTPASLNGSAVSGQSPYTFRWEPADKVLNPGQSSSTTVYLSNTTGFTLTVTDNHGCVTSDQTQVTVSGGPLDVNPVAENSPVCKGVSTRLHALGEGGAGNYTYSWISNPAGFTSQDANPFVTPQVTTAYSVVISDGFNARQDSVTVRVNPLPLINLIPAGSHILSTDTILTCILDTLTIDATNPNATYLWTNGAVTPSILSSTTGIGFDIQTFGVNVVNTLTGCENSGEITILFTYSECSYGEAEINMQDLTVFPLPANDKIFLRGKNLNGDLTYNLMDLQGRTVDAGRIRDDGQAGFSGSITIETLPGGIYFLRIMEKDLYHVIKVVKY